MTDDIPTIGSGDRIVSAANELDAAHRLLDQEPNVIPRDRALDLSTRIMCRPGRRPTGSLSRRAATRCGSPPRPYVGCAWRVGAAHRSKLLQTARQIHQGRSLSCARRSLNANVPSARWSSPNRVIAAEIVGAPGSKPSVVSGGWWLSEPLGRRLTILSSVSTTNWGQRMNSSREYDTSSVAQDPGAATSSSAYCSLRDGRPTVGGRAVLHGR